MLEKIDLKKKLDRKDYNLLMDDLIPRVARLQRECKAAGIPITIVFEGWGAAGKGTMINQLIGPLDPRGFKVFTVQKPSEEEVMRPFLWRFWTKLPAKGRIHIFDRSWYQRVLDSDSGENVFREIVHFEEELAIDGMTIIKFFLHISAKEQKRRFRELEKSKETSWRVKEKDWLQNKNYEDYLAIFDDMIAKTDLSVAPWTIVEASDREFAAAKILTVVAEKMEKALAYKQEMNAAKAAVQSPDSVQEEAGEISQEQQKKKELEDFLALNVLKGADLSLALTKDEYKKKLEELQARMASLHYEMYKRRIPVVLAFEGWDAGGKGGAIKRLTECMDPRGYEVIPVSAPNDIERAHHYLWRFWNAMPKAGHMTIFDRTWYGRVMVERIEGFCTRKEWERAYNEINHMEEHLSNSGCVVIKFWMHIDEQEQLTRFTERQQNPDKQWKITEEDWRNRDKWSLYEEAVNEMIIRTSTNDAPWVIVEANNKYYARIKVLETVVEALEKKMNSK